MMGLTRLVLGLTHLILVGTIVAAGVERTLPSPRMQPSDKGIVPQGKDPYANVFQALQEYRARQELRPAQPSKAGPATQPRVVCGMVVTPVKPSADPRMVIQPKQDPKPDYYIRKIAPQICNE
jgi:hypothetical protein